MSAYEIHECRFGSRTVVYAHDYKAAGTTVLAMVRELCPNAVKLYQSSHKGRLLPDPGNPTKSFGENYTLFTFVRDPVERFQSGLFELSVRHDKWINNMISLKEDKMKKAMENKKKNAFNVTVASLAIEDLLHRTRGAYVDPHIQPQALFFIDKNQRTLPLSYVGVVSPNFEQEIQTIAVKLFGWTDAKGSVIKALQDKSHARDSHDLVYRSRAIENGNVRDEHIDDITKNNIHRFYDIDYACFGFT